jgi:tetratricopeptide (TPR) repeat protein
MSSAVIAACNEALMPGGLDGKDRALGLYNRGRAREALADQAGSDTDLREAAAQYTAIMSSWHPQPEILYGRAKAWHALGEADKALADYNRAAQLNPLDSMIFLNRGILLAHEKRDRYLALIDFERVLALEPASSRVLRRAEQESAALTQVANAEPKKAGERGPAIMEPVQKN